MKDKEFKSWIEKSMIERAPEGFTDRLMEAIAIENEKLVKAPSYKLPGKYLLFFMGFILIFSVIASLLAPSKGIGEWNNYRHYFQMDWTKMNLNSLINNPIIIYTIVGLFLFLFLDYLFISKKHSYSVR